MPIAAPDLFTIANRPHGPVSGAVAMIHHRLPHLSARARRALIA